MDTPDDQTGNDAASGDSAQGEGGNPAQATQPSREEADTNDGNHARVEEALTQAQASLDEVQNAIPDDSGNGEDGAGGEGGEAGHANPGLPEFTPSNAKARTPAGIDLLGDVDLDVTIELGRTEMRVEDVLRLQAGSIVEMDKLAGDPVDVYVNGRLIARGEVLVLNDNFCIRITEIVADLNKQVEAVQRESAGQAA